MAGDVCGCGCGETPTPGRRYLLGHYSASLKRDTPRGTRTERCPRCGLSAPVKDDGTFGAHWSTKRKVRERFRCPEGGQPAPAREVRPGRRVAVTVDVVLPHGWDVPRFKREAHQVLRAHLDEVFVVSAKVGEVAS